MPQIRDLVAQLKPDTWRTKIGFSPDLEKCTNVLLRKESTNEARIDSLREWLSKEQPCVFGRIAAGAPDLISFCLLDEGDLANNDSYIQNKIQASRDEWKLQASLGEKSAFVIVAFSRALFEAAPDENLKALAIRLLSLYLV